MFRDGSKSLGGGGWAAAERGLVISFLAAGTAWVVQFSASYGGGSSCFVTGIGSHLTQSTTKVTPSSSVAEKVHLGGVQ